MTNDTWFLVTKWPKMMGIPTVGWVEFGQLIFSFRDSVGIDTYEPTPGNGPFGFGSALKLDGTEVKIDNKFYVP